MPNKQFKVKDLAKIIKDEKLSWTVNEDRQPEDLIHLHSLGAVPPEDLKLASEEKPVNLKTQINEETHNPFLYERRKTLGYITGEAAKKTYAENPMLTPEIMKELEAPGAASSVDWRLRWGWRWITMPKNQNPCLNCWAFSAACVVESMIRIEHCVWGVRSEGDIRDGMGYKCGQGGWPQDALTWVKTHGVADPGCYPFYNYDHAYTPTADRNGRITYVPGNVALSTAANQKAWLDAVGPITMVFEVWHDFDGYGGGVYVKSNSSTNYYRGLHAVTIVGYDDTNQCWICKNSWGQTWGESWNGIKGYFRIKYGQVKCDDYTKYGVRYTNPDPWTKRRLHNGNLLESGDGALHRNFEALYATAKHVQHYWRDGSTHAWNAGPVFGNDVAYMPTLTSTTFNRNLECVYLTTGGRLHHWWRNQANGVWNDGGVFGPTDADGAPGFIQSNYGVPGNFEVVVRTKDGMLNQWWRDGAGWQNGGKFGGGIAHSGPSLVQSNYWVKGNFELVAVNGTTHQMQHFWRDNDHGNVWHVGASFGSKVDSPPVMIQSQFGATNENSTGNFELCVAVGGMVQHWWRDNASNMGWHMSTTFGKNVKAVVGLLQGSYGFNLECLVVLNTGHMEHWWRDGAGWHFGAQIV
jgi:C1A family cysteine protease